ncbi:MAG TPA: hypothetical protein VK869_00165 [Rubrobacteraceae bacterium]|nr:hypothetical protein [Rubrobacteraceae bacterium]
MKPNTRKAIPAALLALGVLMLALSGCGGAAAGDPKTGARNAREGPSPYTGNFVGEVEGTDAFVAVVVDRENHALAHLCDGKQVVEWFTGAVAEDGTLDLKSEGGALGG